MKELYEAPEMEVVRFEETDVVTESMCSCSNETAVVSWP